MQIENLNDSFWTDDYKILFDKEKLTDFFPTVNMTMIEKLNSIMRLSIYLSLALYILTGNYHYLFIMIIVAFFTYVIYATQKDNLELYFNSKPHSDENLIQKNVYENETDIKPTVQNPFMNINLITDNKEKEAAPPSWNNEEIQEKIEDKFNYNLYRDVGDLYGKSNSQREYYTMPSTTIPNNQTSFAKWCYGVGPTCKEKSIYCAPEMNQVPYLDTNMTGVLTEPKF